MTDESANPGVPATGAANAPGLPAPGARLPEVADGPPSRPSWTGCGSGRRRTPGKATRSPRPGGGCRWSRWIPAFRSPVRTGRSPCSTRSRRRQLIAYYFMWWDGHPAAEQCEGCTFYTTQVSELSHLHSRDITYATLCQGPYDESLRYRDFMGWNMPWYSAHDSLDELLAGRQIGLFHLVCYLRDGDRVFETYWTKRRGVEAMDYSYALMDLTAYGRQEPWEDSPPGWPQRCSNTRTDGGPPDWPPVAAWPGGRPIAQWPRLAAGRSNDLTTPP